MYEIKTVGVVGPGKVGREIITRIRDNYDKVLFWGRDFEKTKGIERSHKRRNVRAVKGLENVLSSDVIIVSAGIHLPDRSKCLEENSRIIRGVFYKKLLNYKGLVINIVNPVDEITRVIYDETGVNVVGLNHADVSRLRYLINEEYKTKHLDSEGCDKIKCLVIGNHNKEMVPLFSKIQMVKDGERFGFYDLFSEYEKRRITKKLIDFGREQIEITGTKTHVETADAILEVLKVIENQADYVCMSVPFQDICIGLPVRFEGLDAKANLGIFDEIDKDERKAFEIACNAVRRNLKRI